MKNTKGKANAVVEKRNVCRLGLTPQVNNVEGGNEGLILLASQSVWMDAFPAPCPSVEGAQFFQSL